MPKGYFASAEAVIPGAWVLVPAKRVGIEMVAPQR
jgi:hypothetical protein